MDQYVIRLLKASREKRYWNIREGFGPLDKATKFESSIEALEMIELFAKLCPFDIFLTGWFEQEAFSLKKGDNLVGYFEGTAMKLIVGETYENNQGIKQVVLRNEEGYDFCRETEEEIYRLGWRKE